MPTKWNPIEYKQWSPIIVARQVTRWEGWHSSCVNHRRKQTFETSGQFAQKISRKQLLYPRAYGGFPTFSLEY